MPETSCWLEWPPKQARAGWLHSDSDCCPMPCAAAVLCPRTGHRPSQQHAAVTHRAARQCRGAAGRGVVVLPARHCWPAAQAAHCLPVSGALMLCLLCLPLMRGATCAVPVVNSAATPNPPPLLLPAAVLRVHHNRPVGQQAVVRSAPHLLPLLVPCGIHRRWVHSCWGRGDR